MRWAYRLRPDVEAWSAIDCVVRIDWPSFGALVDPGGNDGTFLCGLLTRFPRVTGTLMDSYSAIVNADPAMATAGFAERVSLVTGDLLKDPIPAGAGRTD